MTRSGDTLWAEAPNQKRVKVSVSGQLTKQGEYLTAQHGIVLPRQDLRPQETYFRGNTEYGKLASGEEVKLRDAKGNLTARGKQYYNQEEIIVLAPAIQSGTNRSTGKDFEIKTQITLTEDRLPEIGQVFRRAGGSVQQRAAIVVNYLKSSLAEKQLLLQVSEQEWKYDSSGSFTVRTKSRVGNDLQVIDIPLRHEFPLRYDFMLHHSKLLPESFDRGGQCMVRQIAKVTKLCPGVIEQTFDNMFSFFATSLPLADETGELRV